jgi:hypothetical protein
MITEFKIFENSEDKVTLVLNDIIDYFNCVEDSIRNFIFKLLDYNNNIIEFECAKCTDMVNGVTHFININRHHKGILRGRGYGFNYDEKRIYLALNLKRIKYYHDVDTNLPMTIYGNIPNDIKNIINDLNLIRSAKNFNI